jgi:pimeloyl-ACP methyl ester carboxylesterase
MSPPETRYAKSGDVSIAYQVSGSGPLDLIFVPGFVSNLDVYWERPDLLARLGRFSRLIRFDVEKSGSVACAGRAITVANMRPSNRIRPYTSEFPDYAILRPGGNRRKLSAPLGQGSPNPCCIERLIGRRSRHH